VGEKSNATKGLRAAWPWFLLAAALALWTFSGRGGSGLPRGEEIPPLTVMTTDGELTLGEPRSGVTVLAFWATWCPSCRTEGPVLSRVHERIRARGDRVVGLSVDDMPLERIASAARRYGMAYPVARVTRAQSDAYSVELLPTIYVVAADGHVTETFTGAVSERALLDAIDAARDHRVSAR